jgi:hypothetical protein
LPGRTVCSASRSPRVDIGYYFGGVWKSAR